MHNSRLTVLSAFTGLGGLDVGLEYAGFVNVGCIERSATARASLAANRPQWRLLEPHEICAVARDLTPRMLGLRRGELSLLAGAPVCQPFSKAAQWTQSGRRGLKDPRSQCLTGFFVLVERLLPKIVLIENVPGFVAGKQSALGRVRRSLERINRNHATNYQVTCHIVDAADYGVPQHRKRAILVAHRGGKSFKMPSPTYQHKPITAWDALAPGKTVAPLECDDGGWLDLLPSIPEGRNYLWHTPRGGGMPLFGYRTRYWSFLLKLAKDRPAWTLAAQPGPYTGPFHWGNRRLTERESLRLQSIPTTWVVAGARPERVWQIGNATPSLLAEVVGRAIATQFFGCEFRKSPRLQIKRSNRLPVSMPVPRPPRAYHKLARDWPDHPGAGKGPRPRNSLVST